MGDMWRGYDDVLDRPVAVKVVRRQAVAGSPQLAGEFAKRFKRAYRRCASGSGASCPRPVRSPRPVGRGCGECPIRRASSVSRTRRAPAPVRAGPYPPQSIRTPHLRFPVAVPERLREEIAEAYAHSDALLDEERFTQAAEVLSEIIEPAARALGAENKKVLELRTQRAAIQLLGGDYRAALPEFDALADAHARTGGPSSAQARACRAQAARCRAELGQATDALVALRAVLDVVRAVDGDVSEEAVELRRDIGMLLLAQGEAPEAQLILGPLHEDLCLVYGPTDDLSEEVAEALALIELDLDGPAA